MKFKSNFKVVAPATIANLACGLDILGVALENLKDEIIVKPATKPGIHINAIFNNKTKIPLDINKNAAGFSAQSLLDHLKKEHQLENHWGLDLTIHKKIAIGYGLGSSSASAVAGAFAVNEAFGSPLSKHELIPFIVQGEQLAEGHLRINSLIPSLLGGVTMVRNHKLLDFHRLPLVRGLYFVILNARNHTLTQRQARVKLPETISLKIATQQAANTAALIQGFYTSNLELISRSMIDHITEEHLSLSIPFFLDIKKAALDNKALSSSITGIGTGIFALCKNSLEAEQVAEAMKGIYDSNNIRYNLLISKIDQDGVKTA